MNEVAMHLVEQVFPNVPVRQFVLSFPFSVRYLLAYNPLLVTKILGIYLRVITNWYTKAARRNGYEGKTAAITFIQRFGSAINLNVHFHALLIDGVYIVENGEPNFIPVFPPTDEEMMTLVARINLRVTRFLYKKGYALDDFSEDPFAHEQPVLAHIAGASVKSRIGLGERTGLKVRRVGEECSIGNAYIVSSRCALSDGFSLHANLQIKRDDRKGLEKLCRYTARPSIALERMSETPEGKILYKLKTRYSDGTTHILLDPIELVEKIVALIPPPKANLLRYHGLLAPNAKLRSKIIPKTRKKAESSQYTGKSKWAELLKRSFAIDILKCNHCGGKMKVLATIQDKEIAKQILGSIGINSEAPVKASPRAPPQKEMDYSQFDDFSQVTFYSNSFE